MQFGGLESGSVARIRIEQLGWWIRRSGSISDAGWGQCLTAYLDHYEYTCTEQLLSKGFSALILISRPEFGTIKNRTDQPLGATYSTLRGRMDDQGGLGLWSSTPDTAEFPTVYAAHFLVEARDHGQKIPDEVLTTLDGLISISLANHAQTSPASCRKPSAPSPLRACRIEHRVPNSTAMSTASTIAREIATFDDVGQTQGTASDFRPCLPSR